MNDTTKKICVRILTAVIEVDKDGNESVTPACIDIPVSASSVDRAIQLVTNALTNLIPAPITPGEYSNILKSLTIPPRNTFDQYPQYSKNFPKQPSPWVQKRTIPNLPSSGQTRNRKEEQTGVVEQIKKLLKGI